MTHDSVDAVITWVDGNEPAHREKLASYLMKIGISRPEAAAPTRFNECGEINYCIKSLLRFAPWIRTIYIVTGSQIPSIIDEFRGTPYEEKIKLIDEREIFYDFEHCLPTFNSISIESLIWRIPGISNNFIYFNDDWSLIRPVSYEDFFRNDKVVLRGHWSVQSERKVGHYWQVFLNYIFKQKSSVDTDLYRVVQENSAKLAGWNSLFFHLPHAPLPARKKTLETFFEERPDLLLKNIRYAFRDEQQFLPLSLAQHLDIKNKQGIIDNTLKAVYINAAFHSLEKIQQRLKHADRNKNAAFACIQSMDLASEAIQKTVFKWLDKRILL